MGPLALLGFVSLCAGLVLAEVTTNFNDCTDHFYNQIEPQGFDGPNRASICQKYENEYRFATLYDKNSRIPIWSAYIMVKEEKCKDKNQVEKKWKLEPQLSCLREPNMKTLKDMMTAENFQKIREVKDKQKDKQKEKQKEKPEDQLKAHVKESQAISDDYAKTGFDQGHLNPNCLHMGQDGTATYTLTNAAPMDPCFNRVTWYELERNLKQQLKDNCVKLGGKPFLVTGAVHNDKYKIPQNEKRVVVPSHIWTAVCCDHSDQNQKFSFAFLGENKRDSTLKSMTVTDLDKHLKKLYGNRPIKIFNNDCNQGSKSETEIVEKITEELHSSFPNWDDEEGNTHSQNEAEILKKIIELLDSSFPNWRDERGNTHSPNAPLISAEIIKLLHSSFPNTKDVPLSRKRSRKSK